MFGWWILPEIFHIGNGYGWILHAVIDDRVDGHRHGVTWQDLDNIKKDHANIECGDVLDVIIGIIIIIKMMNR